MKRILLLLLVLMFTVSTFAETDSLYDRLCSGTPAKCEVEVWEGEVLTLGDNSIIRSNILQDNEFGYLEILNAEADSVILMGRFETRHQIEALLDETLPPDGDIDISETTIQMAGLNCIPMYYTFEGQNVGVCIMEHGTGCLLFAAVLGEGETNPEEHLEQWSAVFDIAE